MSRSFFIPVLLIIAGCGTSQDEIREKAFRDAARSYLAEVILAMDNVRREGSAEACRKAAAGLKEKYQTLPDAGGNKTFEGVHEQFRVINDRIESLARLMATAEKSPQDPNLVLKISSMLDTVSDDVVVIRKTFRQKVF